MRATASSSKRKKGTTLTFPFVVKEYRALVGELCGAADVAKYDRLVESGEQPEVAYHRVVVRRLNQGRATNEGTLESDRRRVRGSDCDTDCMGA